VLGVAGALVSTVELVEILARTVVYGTDQSTSIHAITFRETITT
jgi:hypothetical protein